MVDRLVLERFYRTAVEAVHPKNILSRQLVRTGDWLTLAGRKFDLSVLGKFRVVAIGKAAATMMAEVESELADLIEGGVVVVPHGSRFRSDVCMVIEAGHPIPDEGSQRAEAAIRNMVTGLGTHDLVLVLMSGGASALVGDMGAIPLPEWQSLFGKLLHSGADIAEMNTVRKHLSTLKGGRLAALAHPATVVSMIISDVIGDRLDVIGSGPTVADPTTWSDAVAVLDKYQLRSSLSVPLQQMLQDGLAGRLADTPKPGDPRLATTHNLLVGSNTMAMEAVAREAKWQKYHVLLDPEPLKGEARLAGEVMAYRMATYKGPRPAIFIRGGETTVTVKGRGSGGRCQEFVLAMVHAWHRMGLTPSQMPAVLAAGTDGRDGPTDAAGGFADAGVVLHMQALSLDPEAFLGNNDAYHFLQQVNGLFITGATGTNVADVVIGLAN